MPEQPDEDRMPPLKVMRKRLNGVYRADSGFSGPTRRYVLIVALLVGLASVPTLAAITAGSNELADGNTDTMDVPFLPPASPGPIQSPPGSGVGASPFTLPPGAAEAIGRAGRELGKIGKIKSSKPPISYAGKHTVRTWAQSGSDRPAARPHRTTPTGTPSMAAFPPLPGMPALPRLPAVSGRAAHHPHHDETPPPSSPSDPSTDIVDPSQLARSAFPDMSDDDDDSSSQQYSSHCSRSTASHRRRSVVPERPHNIRAASILERSYAQGSLNRRSLIPEARAEDNRGDGPYRGSHRAGSQHQHQRHADDSQADLRSSRVGRHHAEHNTDDLTGRW